MARCYKGGLYKGIPVALGSGPIPAQTGPAQPGRLPAPKEGRWLVGPLNKGF
jgi:hypothetical protein